MLYYIFRLAPACNTNFSAQTTYYTSGILHIFSFPIVPARNKREAKTPPPPKLWCTVTWRWEHSLHYSSVTSFTMELEVQNDCDIVQV